MKTMEQFTRLGGAAPLVATADVIVGVCAGLTLPLHLIAGHARTMIGATRA
jgi:hypothetical protein